MDPISGDSRFSKLAKDKKFLSVSKKHKKVKIDKRFQSLFTSEKFVNKCSVDKRGRPKSLSAKENYEKFYDLDDSDTSDSDDDDVNDGSENSIEEDSNIHQPKPNVDDDETVLESDIKTKLLSSSVDYARGEADLYSDSSSEEDADSDEEEEQKEEEEHEYFDKWGELDGEAERTEDATDRLAVCNMDWDRVGAEDIFLVLSSFCPASGSVTSVQVFLSDFGKERMEEEKTLGPKELRQLKGENDEDDDDGLVVDKKKALKEAAAAMDRVRQYQVARLKYYYAVVQFDCVESASRVYTECDGMEYELSATRVDLRYIPPAMTFDTPSSSCLTPPHPDKYQPKTFFTTALQQGKVELTWDEANLDRVKALKDAYSKMEEGEELENMADLIASASEDEDEGGDEKEGSEEEPDNDKDTISKYRALLVGIGGKDEKSVEGNMEVTWNDEDRAEESQEEATPWEKYLQRKKDKKRKKPETIDVDDVPEGVDMSDPFFAEEIGEEEQSKKKKKKMNDILDENEDSNELALMVMDSDDEKEHFNFKDIVESETKSGKSKKKKWKKKKKEVEIPTEDNFSVDVTDDRFSSLFSRPEFNIDPTEPNFKKTKNMEKIIQEKQKRIDKTITSEAGKVGKKLKLDPEVSSSLKSVKNKWKKNAKKGKQI
eukprot:GFUD01017137.1.p1 GENE.GFUD01017137.1~~GFUD01017137.1.p1  ORF type:complete len:658 (+),score=333.16 GFUD01017137.1:57-2030(+)